MPEQEDPIWERMKRTMDFILEQQANLVVRQAKTDERAEEAARRAREYEERHNREMVEIRQTLRRAIKLGIQEARNQRKRRQELEAQTREIQAQARERQAATEARFERLEMLNAEGTEKLNALIQIVDELIRRGRQPGA